ncbi:MAG: nuclear transport factor 2 family protein [Bacteroidota bacterium]|nr:nuclear transport factor 2 family protein [Bacteroidota bacterium]
MTTKEVADRLVELCRNGKIEDAQNELYAKDAISIEPNDSMGPRETKGMEGIKKKGEMFNSMMEEFHGSTISDPVIAGNYFSLAWDMDAKMKGQERMMMSEICLYLVKEGKIVSEEFFFSM